MATKKDLLVLLLDVGEHMQPYLPLLHRLVFHVLTGKLVNKPNHEVAIVLYGTEGTRHKLYDPEDPGYEHVTVLRPLQNLASYLHLAPFAFASDPPAAADDDGATAAGEPNAEAEAALLARVEAAGLVPSGAEGPAAVARAARLFGSPAAGAKSDWGDGLVVAMDLLATAIAERFEDPKEAKKLGAVRLLIVSNFLAEFNPFEDDFRSSLVGMCHKHRVQLDVACLDHYVPPPGEGAAAASSFPAAAAAELDPLAVLPGHLAALRSSSLEELHKILAEVAPSTVRHLRHPGELLCLFGSKETALQASNAVFKLSPGPAPDEDQHVAAAPLTLNVKLYKKIRHCRVEEWKTAMEANPAGAAADAGPDADADAGPRFVREVEYEDPTSGEKFSADEYVVRGYSYGKQLVPVGSYVEEAGLAAGGQVARFRDKDFSLLGFIRVEGVPLHRLIDEPQVVIGDSPASAVAIAALALVLQEKKQAAVVRFLLRKENPSLGLLTPHLSDSSDVPHALLLNPLPFAEDIRQHAFTTFRNEDQARDLPRQLAAARGEEPPEVEVAAVEEGQAGDSAGQLSRMLEKAVTDAPTMRFEKLQPSEEQQDAALALVRSLDLGPLPGAGGGHREPRPEQLSPETTPNPLLQRMYDLVTSRALDDTAQLPHPDDDPLVQLVLQPNERLWRPEARAALKRAEELLQTRERISGYDAKRPRRESDEAGGAEVEAVGAGGDEAAAAAEGATSAAGRREAAAVFDPNAAAGTSRRVTRVSELAAVEDFQAMLAQGRDSAPDAVRQMQGIIELLVGKSIGEQLYDKALQCVRALRAGCVATGRAGAFNTFLRNFAEWCNQLDRGPFVSLLLSHDLGLITTSELTTRQAAGAAAATATTTTTTGTGPGVLAFEDDGGAVDPLTAVQFSEAHAARDEAADEATLAAVVGDEEFEDMD